MGLEARMSKKSAEAVIREIADGAALVEFSDATDSEANRRAVAVAKALTERPRRGLLAGIPGARTLLLLFEPGRLDLARLSKEALRTGREGNASGASPRVFTIPVVYGGAAALDLPDLARGVGLSESEFVRRHASALYRVAFLGFAPGFAYLTGLPKELAAPRLSTPRTRVPAGAVAIGGEYTGVYPEQTPGGWRLIGRSPARLFDARQDPPALLAPGDQVRFEAIREDEFARRTEPMKDRVCDPPIIAGAPLLRVVHAGLWTSVQGERRYEWVSCGVAPGGAMDPEALALANGLLGNPSGAAGLEITLAGPELEALADVSACLAGAEAEVHRNGKPVLPGAVLSLRAGDRLRVGAVKRGARVYLCFKEGLAQSDQPAVSRRLCPGDTVLLRSHGVRRRQAAARRENEDAQGPRLAASLPLHLGTAVGRNAATAEMVVRVVLGPQKGHFAEEGIATFLKAAYRVSSASDRRGVRLEGERIAHRRSPDIPPEGTPLGAIQVARDGQPIILGPDRPVTGGYAKIATVIGADFRKVAQAAPGSLLRFQAVALAEALEARRSANHS